MAHCIIGLGSNLGDRESLLRSAWGQIGRLPGSRAIGRSSFHATAPAGGPAGQGEFLNAVGLLETPLTAEQLLTELQQIEQSLGRVRIEHWGPRAVDLDLLMFDACQLDTPHLVLPHPRMAFRLFVLEPAAEVAPRAIYPINGWTIAKLLDHAIKAPNVIALTATDPDLLREALSQIAGEPHRTEGFEILSHWPAEQAALASVSHAEADPKLVVVVESSAPLSPEAALRAANWRKLRNRYEVGPVLWLRTADPRVVAEEVFGAIAAMR